MIIETWEVVRFNFIIVFILSCYLISGTIYIFYNHKKKTLMKVLTHFIVGAIIVLGISYAISVMSHKTVHVIYQYDNESEVLYMVDRGWQVIEHNRDYQRVHFSKQYKKGKIRWFYPSRGGKIE